MAQVLNRVVHGKGGGFFPSAFFYGPALTSSGSAILTGEGKTYNGVWGTQQRVRLPSEYQEVEWIQSSGTQYISTGVTSASGIGFDAKLTFTAKFDHNFMIGNWAYVNYGLYNSGTEGGVNGKYAQPLSTSADFTTLNKDYVVVANGTTITVNDTTFTPGASGGSTGGMLCLFGCSNAADQVPYSWNGYGQGKMYYAKILKNGIPIRNFVPCYRKSDGVIGMYDLCGSTCSLTNSSFYINSGTGTFTKSADHDTYITISGFNFPKINKIGTYTYTIVQGEQTVSNTLLIDAITNYQIPIVMALYLYNYGNEYTDVTGGWTTFFHGVVTKNSDHIQVYYNYNDSNHQWGGTSPSNKIDLTPYTTLHMIAIGENGSTTYPNFTGGYSTQESVTGDQYINVAGLAWASSEGTVEKTADISDINAEVYICFCGWYCITSSGYGRLYKCWLT